MKHVKIIEEVTIDFDNGVVGKYGPGVCIKVVGYLATQLVGQGYARYTSKSRFKSYWNETERMAKNKKAMGKVQAMNMANKKILGDGSEYYKINGNLVRTTSKTL